MEQYQQYIVVMESGFILSSMDSEYPHHIISYHMPGSPITPKLSPMKGDDLQLPNIDVSPLCAMATLRISWLWREWHWQLVGRHDIHSHLMDPGSEWLESLRWALSSHAPCITLAISWEKWTPCRQHRHRTACNFGSEHCRVRHDLVKFNAAQPEPESMLN